MHRYCTNPKHELPMDACHTACCMPWTRAEPVAATKGWFKKAQADLFTSSLHTLLLAPPKQHQLFPRAVT